MGVKLLSSSGGSVEVNPPATASNFTQTLVPVSNTLAPLVSGTAVASTSGTSIDFTSIPSWVKRITVMFSGVSTNGTSIIQIQVGSGSVTTSGYYSTASLGGVSSNGGTITSGIALGYTNSAASVYTGVMVLSLLGSNTWLSSGTSTFEQASGYGYTYAGKTPALGGALDRVRITTANGTDTFDAGSINILYE